MRLNRAESTMVENPEAVDLQSRKLVASKNSSASAEGERRGRAALSKGPPSSCMFADASTVDAEATNVAPEEDDSPPPEKFAKSSSSPDS